MSHALILMIESSETNLGAGEHWRNEEYTKPGGEPLEEEAIKCVKAWRKNAGKFKDIPIYCMCPSKRVPKDKTIRKLKEHGVVYIQEHMPITERFSCGYFNVPLGCSWLETTLHEDILIHIDLDMQIIKDPSKLIEIPIGIDAVIGALPNEDRKDVHIFKSDYHFESNFIVAWRNSDFYFKWYVEFLRLRRSFDKDWERYAEVEEFAIDSIYLSGIKKIKPVQYYQVGSRYRAKDIPEEKLDEVYFFHAHPYEPKDEYDKYMRRLLKCRR